MFFLAVFLLFSSFLGVFAGRAHHSLIRTRHRQHSARLAPPSPNCCNSSKTFALTDYYHGQTFLTYVVPAEDAFASPYSLAFTSDWDFFTEDDPTHGNVQYQSKSNAISKGLAFVQNDGTTVLAVDDKTPLPVGGKRDSLVFNLVSLQPPMAYLVIQCPYQHEEEIQWWIVHC
jgi:hypothetical protein